MAWIALLELVVLVVVLLRVLARRSGSPGLFRGLWHQVTATARAFAAPFAAWWRDRRGVAVLTRRIGEPRTYEVAARAWAAAGSIGVRPWAAVVAGERVSVLLTAAGAPSVEEPWSADPKDARRWSIAVTDLPATSAEPTALPVVVGLLGDGVVVLDLSAAPPVLATGGDPRAARDLVHALTAQLSARRPAAVGVAHGVHPRFSGRPMEDLLGDTGLRVLVCAAPEANADVERRLSSFADAGRCVLVLGDVRGRRLVLRPDAYGVLPAADALGPVETAMLARAVARAVRSGRLVAAALPGDPAAPGGTAGAGGTGGSEPAVVAPAVAEPGPAAPAVGAPAVVAPVAAASASFGRSASAVTAAAAGPAPAPLPDPAAAAGPATAAPRTRVPASTSAAAAPPAAAAVPAVPGAPAEPEPLSPEPAARPPAFASARGTAAVPPPEPAADRPAGPAAAASTSAEPTRP